MGGKGLIVPKLCPICGHTGGQVRHVNPRRTRVPESVHSIFSSPWIGAGARGFDDDDTGGSRLDFQQQPGR